uniref:hypothetical protein n=1 Tax=Methanosarcina horonobensis TaxID=418008 RepID=UPI000AC7A70C|nr:hypothetical protein [Methanosarcina horonobensis]
MIILETRSLKYTYPDGTAAVQDINIEIKKRKKNRLCRAERLREVNAFPAPERDLKTPGR